MLNWQIIYLFIYLNNIAYTSMKLKSKENYLENSKFIRVN